jgi:hypothetical protein
LLVEGPWILWGDAVALFFCASAHFAAAFFMEMVIILPVRWQSRQF